MKQIVLGFSLTVMTAIGFSEGIPIADFSQESNKLQHLPPTQSEQKTGKIIAYLPGWSTPPAAEDLAAAGYTHVIVAFGVFSTITPGQIVSAFDSVTPAYIKSLQTAGIKVLLSLGGASTNIVNTTVNFHSVLEKVSDPQCFTEEFVSSVEDMLTQYGFDGVDIDIEHGLIGAGSFVNPTGDIAVMANILHTLHNKHPNILLSLAPQMSNISPTRGFGDTWGNYASLVMQTAPILSWVGIQLYNSGCCLGIDNVCYGFDPSHPEKYVDTYVAMATSLLEDWPVKDRANRATGFQPYMSYLKSSQIVLGFPAVDKNGVTDNASPVANMSAVKRSINCLRTATTSSTSCHTYTVPRPYPNIGGVFEWQVTYDQSNDYYFAKSLKKCVMSGNCE